jgi:hypothetical protein
MLLEIRRYTIVPGRRDEFAAWFDEEVLPLFESLGIDVVGQFVSEDDPDAFVYLRRFADAAERDRRYAALDADPVWNERIKPRALELETSAVVEVVTPTGRSRMR